MKTYTIFYTVNGENKSGNAFGTDVFEALVQFVKDLKAETSQDDVIEIESIYRFKHQPA